MFMGVYGFAWIQAITYKVVCTWGLGLTGTTASPMAGYGRGHSFFLKMAMVAEF